MQRYFLDSSALVKRYLEEPGTSAVLELFNPPGQVVVSRLTMVEVMAAAARRAKNGEVSDDLLRRLVSSVEDDFRTVLEVVELGMSIVTRAVDLVRMHALRAADGIQLASALASAGGPASGATLILVSSDNELNAAAQAEGLAVMDPTRGG
jgi:predicted nucleic acid-binding protein